MRPQDVHTACCFMPHLLEVWTGGESRCKTQANDQCAGVQGPFSDQHIQEAPSKCDSGDVAAIFGMFSGTEESII